MDVVEATPRVKVAKPCVGGGHGASWAYMKTRERSRAVHGVALETDTLLQGSVGEIELRIATVCDLN